MRARARSAARSLAGADLVRSVFPAVLLVLRLTYVRPRRGPSRSFLAQFWLLRTRRMHMSSCGVLGTPLASPLYTRAVSLELEID